MKKVKQILLIILIILITVSCIAIGIRTRYMQGINITQIISSKKDNEIAGYAIKTSKDNLIIIDGGYKEDVSKLKQIINEKGGVVEYWFVTIPNESHTGALTEILKEENITINNIFVSLNEEEWYVKNDLENSTGISEFMNHLYLGKYRTVVQEVGFRQEFKLDNLIIKVLGIKDENRTENPKNNQNMIIKITNNFKSVLFLGQIGEENSIKFKDNNLDEIKSDVVQVSGILENKIERDIFEMIDADIYFTSQDKFNNKIKFKEKSVVYDNDTTVKIW